MDQEVVIVDIRCHFPTVHGDVTAKIAKAFVFREVRHLEFLREYHVRNQTEASSVDAKGGETLYGPYSVVQELIIRRSGRINSGRSDLTGWSRGFRGYLSRHVRSQQHLRRV